MSEAEGVPESAAPINADLAQDLIRRLRDLEAIVKRLNEGPPPSALRRFWRARIRPARVGAAALLVVLGASMVFAETRFTGLFVDKSGNVGIGTTEPGNYTLRVNGSLSVAGPVKVGNDSIPVASQPLRLIGGTVVHSSGCCSASYQSDVERRGWSVVRQEENPKGCGASKGTAALYRVTFVQPFTGRPAVSIVAISGQGNAALGDVGSRLPPPPFEALLPEETATLTSLDNKEMVVRTWTPNCPRTPPIFSFIAIGPA
jgi:hypothetical protein